MQGNGFKLFAALAFLALSIWYLFPTFQNYLLQRDMAQMTAEERTRYEEANFEDIQRLRERALKLGLDLQGGMHVTLEVRQDALVRALADENEIDAGFEQALATARQRTAETGGDFADAFVQAFEEIDPNVRLARYFRASDRVTRRSTNSEVASFLRREADEAVTRAVSIVRERVDRFGVTEPSIQRQGARRVVVEMPGVDDPQRVRELLRGTARLEFRMMSDHGELASARNRILGYFQGGDPMARPGARPAAPQPAPETATEEVATAEADLAAGQEATLDADTAAVPAADALAAQDPDEGARNPLLEVLRPVPGESVIFAAVAERDTARVNHLLFRDDVQRMLPSGVVLMYTAKPVGRTEDGHQLLYLLGVRGGAPELTGEVITDARPDFDPFTNQPQVSITMNTEGAQIWSRLTGANVGREVAIVMDDVVYSWPRIIDRIPSGRTSITGVSRAEAEDIVVILKSGALPAPVDIVEERMVGPSLGEASIRAGTISVIVGLLLVAVFMVLYYQTAGLIANLALLLNLIFIFGILAAFGATLTLPGIAGIVLTIGMAVDANVLIFDRIREELNSGRSMRAAIEGGYAKALSAIADANITTFFVGVILFSFGVGPIQGFAVTLMAGILSSLFTAIVVTRIIFDYLVAERKSLVAIG
jgi:SecD/SecF fusion protein